MILFYFSISFLKKEEEEEKESSIACKYI